MIDFTHKFKLTWSNLTIADKIQLSLLLLNLFTLIAFIFISSAQISISNKSIKQTDTALAYSIRSFQLTEKSILSSDSSTKEALRISDSSLTISKSNLKINELMMVSANTPYIEVQSRVLKFTVDTLRYEIRYKNCGNTPAISFQTIAGAEISLKNKTHRKITSPNEISTGLLMPKDSCFTIPNITILPSKQIFNKVQSGEYTFKVYGYIKYNDVFGYKYRVDFIYNFDPVTQTFTTPINGNFYKRVL